MKSMKKIARKIAMILMLVMLCNVFISCFTAWCIDLIESDKKFLQVVGVLLFVPALALDLITIPIQAPLGLGPFTGSKKSVITMEGEAILPEADTVFITEIMEITDCLSEADGGFFKALAVSLPELKLAALLEHRNSVSELQFASEVKALHAIYTLPQSERILLAQAIKSLPEAERAFITETSSSLSDAQIAVLADEFCSMSPADIAYQARVMLETPSANWGYREYAAQRFITAK